MEDGSDLDLASGYILEEGTGDFGTEMEELSQMNLDPAEGQGDHTDLFEDYCFDGNTQDMFLPSAYSSDNSQEDWQNFNWADDMDSDEDLDDLDYDPITQLLANNGHERDDWYEHPDDEEFRSAFACLNTRKILAKKYLLEMLNACDDYTPLSDVETDPHAIAQVNYALSELCIPQMAKMSVERLCNILIKYPSLDLRQHLEDFDVFTVAYVIWGIDFYMNRKCFNYNEEDTKSADDDYPDAEKFRLSNALVSSWKNSYKWISSTLSTLMSSII